MHPLGHNLAAGVFSLFQRKTSEVKFCHTVDNWCNLRTNPGQVLGTILRKRQKFGAISGIFCASISNINNWGKM